MAISIINFWTAWPGSVRRWPIWPYWFIFELLTQNSFLALFTFRKWTHTFQSLLFLERLWAFWFSFLSYPTFCFKGEFGPSENWRKKENKVVLILRREAARPVFNWCSLNYWKICGNIWQFQQLFFEQHDQVQNDGDRSSRIDSYLDYWL